MFYVIDEAIVWKLLGVSTVGHLRCGSYRRRILLHTTGSSVLVRPGVLQLSSGNGAIPEPTVFRNLRSSRLLEAVPARATLHELFVPPKVPN